MRFKLFFAFIIFTSLCTNSSAQNQSNIGTEFWLGYGAHAAMFNPDGSVNSVTGGSQDMRLYLVASGTAHVTVSMPATGWIQSLTISGINTQVIIPKTGPNDARLTAEGVFNTGIHIVSDVPICAFAHIYDSTGSAETILAPFEILEQSYTVLGFSQAAKENNSFSYCFIVASADSTTVQVTPSTNTRGHSANVPFTQILNKGQVLNLIGNTQGTAGGITTGNDMTGTVIQTLHTGPDTACKKIAVFSGSSNALISCGQSGTGDNLFQQVLPSRAWGLSFITAPTVGMEMNYYRVITSNPSCVVSVNGTRLTGLVNNSYYQFQSKVPCNIAASTPVVVAQYITSAGECSNSGQGSLGDPDMVFLTPINYSLTSTSIFVPQSSNIVADYLNVILRTSIVDSFTIDTIHKAAYFKPVPSDTAYSYAQIPLTQGAHSLVTDSLSFIAMAYGYGKNESYAYNVGFNIRNLSTFSVHNPYNTSHINEVCKTVPFKLSMNIVGIPGRPVRLIYDFKNNPFLSPNNIVDTTNPVFDSVATAGGDTVLWRFTLPATYIYALNGSTSFQVFITIFIPTPEGCIEQRTITYTVLVSAKPVAGILLNYDSCSINALHFKDNSVVPGGKFINWLWNFGDSTYASNITNPVKTYANYGNYVVKLRSITSLGCFADTSKTIAIYPKPTAAFGFNGLPCTLDTISFSDSSSIPNPGIIAKRLWDFGDGTTSVNTTNPIKQYGAGGTYDLTLVAYSDKNCTDTAVKVIKVYGADTLREFITVKNVYPGLDTSMVCRTEPFTLAATFNGRPVQIHWDFSADPNLTPNNNVDLLSPVPDSVYYNGQDSFFRYSLPYTYKYASTGPFNLNIKIYTQTKGTCLAPVVYDNNLQGLDKPAAAWHLNYDSCANDTLYFKDASITPGSSIATWQWAFGDNTGFNVENPAKKYAAYGQYTVSLNITTNIGCYADTTGPVSLNPRPVTGFGFSGTLFCPGSPINFADSSSIVPPGEIVKWLWSFGDGNTSSQQNPSMQYSNSGSFLTSLTVYSDHNCADTLTITVSIYAVPVVTLQPEVYITQGVPYQLTPTYTGNMLTYLWSPAAGLSTDTTAYPIAVTQNNIAYTVTVTGEGGCQANATEKIVVEKPILAPNAFSPNGDGINDKWMIQNIEFFPNCTVRVFNRYGQIVFSSTGYEVPWDGTLNGKPLPVGTFYYIIDTNVPQFPGKAGYVELLR